jgi:hypothetical protein
MACTLASLGSLAASTLAMSWFRGQAGSLDLASSTETAAQVTLFTSIVFALLVVVQAGRRLGNISPLALLSRLGYVVGLVCMVAAGVTAYAFAPEGQSPTWAPVLLFAGCTLGIVALYDAAVPPPEIDVYKPVVVAQPVAPRPSPPPTPQSTRRPAPEAFTLPNARRTPTPSQPPPTSGAPPSVDSVAKVAHQITAMGLRGKLRYATATADITAAGIDARREDGETHLVLWRDVVGIVARRLPQEPPYFGAPFVDVVSGEGATLRFLPWTRVSGVEIGGEGEPRARDVLQLLVARCAAAQLDPATRKFLEGSASPAQLRDATTLAKHDERLA